MVKWSSLMFSALAAGLALAALASLMAVSSAVAESVDEEGHVRLYGVLRWDDGEPIAGGSVGVVQHFKCLETWCQRAPSQHIGTTTNEAGEWSMEAPPGGLMVGGAAPPKLPYGPSNGSVMASMTLRPGAVEEIHLVITKEREPSVTVRVRALDAVDGSPVNARFSVSPSGGPAIYNQTLEQSSPPGVIKITVQASKVKQDPCEGPWPEPENSWEPRVDPMCETKVNDYYYHAWSRFFVVEEGDVLDVDAHLTRIAPFTEVVGTQGQAVGWVVDAVTGEPVADALVQVYNEATLEWGHAFTDVHGAYRFEGTAGHLLLSAQAVGGPLGLAAVDVPEGGVGHVNIQLHNGPGGYCCWNHIDVYEIPLDGALPPPPQSTPLAVDPDDSVFFLHKYWRMNQTDYLELFASLWAEGRYPEWLDVYASLEPGLGPYDPTADLTWPQESRPVFPLTDASGLVVGLVVVALLMVLRRRS